MGTNLCCKQQESNDMEIVTTKDKTSRNNEFSSQKLNAENESLKKRINNLMQQISQKDIIINNKEKQIQILKTSQRSDDDQKIIKSKGLDNIGATCYMNATLQCLSNTKILRNHFLTKFKEAPNQVISNEFHKLLLNLFNENYNKKSYSPYSFKEVLSKENPLFAGIQANDSKDLINFMIERMHQELNVAKINFLNNANSLQQLDQSNENLMLESFLKDYIQQFNSPISNLFYGILETKSQCKNCNIIKFNFQIYSFIEFPLQQVNYYYFTMGKRPLVLPNNKNPDVNLYECFEYYRKVDLMTGENQMYCNICNKLCDSFYSTSLYSAPNYLIINLNRGKGAVYECNVDFPEELNLFDYLSYKISNTTFELYAVICHLGPSSMSGHFVAYIRNNNDYKWYLYNDSIVTECTRPSQYKDGMPYILFYKVLKGGPNASY